MTRKSYGLVLAIRNPLYINFPIQGQRVSETAIQADAHNLYTLPSDLYIPQQALYIKLTNFEGPLDLLLYLIRHQRFDILALPMAELTAQYAYYLDIMKQHDIEPAAEYLAMAAWLTEIKSRMLLPSPTELEDEVDPRAELVQHLQTYEYYKQVSEQLEQIPRHQRDFFTAYAYPSQPLTIEHAKIPIDIDVKELAKIMTNVLQQAACFQHHRIVRHTITLQEKVTDLKKRLCNGQCYDFYQLLSPNEGRLGVVLTFLAILELLRLDRVIVSIMPAKQGFSITWKQK